MLSKIFEDNFLVILAGSVVLGLYLPWINSVPSFALLIFLGITIFFSSFQIRVQEIRGLAFMPVVRFYVLRFLILPIVLFLVATKGLSTFASGIFLLALMPAGAASPGIAHIYKGNISLSLVLVVVSSLLAPFMIPPVLAWFTGKTVALNVWNLFGTLSLTIFLPVGLHLPFRRSQKLVSGFRKFTSPAVVLSVAVMIMIIMAKQREYIWSHLHLLPQLLAISLGVFIVFYLFGWFSSSRSNVKNRISYALASGVNNTALGIVISYIYFPSAVSTFLVVSELPWIFVMMIFRMTLARLRASEIPE